MSLNEINAYYDQTFDQYKQVWKLDEHLGVHYGYWDSSVKNLKESVIKMNEILAREAGFTNSDHILDMGCGIGGSAFYLTENFNCNVTGININEKQIEEAIKFSSIKGLDYKCRFLVKNFLRTGLPNNSYEGVWAIESVCHSQEKEDFIREAYRLLKPNGTLILADFFVTKNSHNQKTSVKNWLEKWAVPNLDTQSNFSEKLSKNGFEVSVVSDLTENIKKSSLLMFLASFPGLITTELNNVISKKGIYWRDHYKSAFWQYIALKKGYWKYYLIKAKKVP